MTPEKKKISVSSLLAKKKKGEKIVAITAYDAPTAKFADEAGVDIILVGDSLGMTVLGYKNTIPVTIEQSLHHCTAAVRGNQNAFVVGDMPFMSFRASTERTMLNAARYLQEARTDGVKIEGGKDVAAIVENLVGAGIPVMGHIGLLPQKLLISGKYSVAGKTEHDAKSLMEDARALEEAGAFCIVLELIPAQLSRQITESVRIPTIGIGAGQFCDGQIQVINDILGLFTDFVPKHARRYAELDKTIRKAVCDYSEDVRNGRFPDEEHSF